MKINVARWDALLRGFLGFVFVFWLFIGGPVWTALGFYLILTAAWAFDPLYVVFKVKTARINEDHLSDPHDSEP